jgi:hypothetical protein
MRIALSVLLLSIVTVSACSSARKTPQGLGECKQDCRLDVITPRSVRGEVRPRFVVRIYDGCDIDPNRLEPTNPADVMNVKDADAGQVVRFDLPVGVTAVLVQAELATSRSARPLAKYRRYREVRSNRVVVDFNSGSSDEWRKKSTCAE